MRFSSILAASVLAAPRLAGAQATASATAARDTLAAAVITATRTAASPATPIATATVLRGDELRARGITRLGDALRLVPGAITVGSGSVGSQTSLFVRGGNSNYTRVLVDGVPVNDAGGFVDLANLTLTGIERVEIVRGPASVLYGSDAVTAVVQLFTRDGAEAPGGRMAASAGTFGTRRGEVGLGGRTTRFRYAVDAATDATDGTLPFNNRYANDVAGASVRWAPDSRTDARLTARWSAATFHYPTDYTGAVVDRNAEQVDHRLIAALDAGRRLSDRLQIRATLTSHEFLPRTNDGPDDAADTTGWYGYFARSVRTRRAADLRVETRAGPRQVITLGVESAHDRERSTSRTLSAFGASAGGFEAARRNTAIYAQVLGDAAARVSYALGARQDLNSAFGRFTTVRASVGQRANATWRWHAAAGTAFKAPSFYENFATGFVTGNPALRPEESASGEVGAEVVPAGGALRLSAAGYVQRFRNIVQYTPTAPAPGAPNYYNVARAAASGLELGARWDRRGSTTAEVTYAWTVTRVTQAGFDSTAGATYVTGEALLRRPRHALSGTLTRRVGTASVSLVATRIGTRDDRDFSSFPARPVKLPPYTRVDAAVLAPLGWRGLAATVRVNNALNARFEEIARFAAPPRAVEVGIAWRP